MTNKQLEETLKTLIANGKDLREAGYTRVAIGDVEAELAQLEPPAPPAREGDQEDEVDERRGNAYDDPDTYPGGGIPRRRGAPRTVEHDEED